MEILQTALTALASLAVLFAMTKLIGRKQVSQMTMFDYINGISIGSIAAEMATELDGPLRPLVAMVVYGFAVYLISILTNKSLKARCFFTGKPLILMDKGVIYRDRLQAAHIDLSEFLTFCRIGGYYDISQLQTAVMEHNGSFSFLPRAAHRPAEPADLSLQPKQGFMLTPVVMDGRVLLKNLQSVGKDETWLLRRLREQHYHEYGDVLLALCDNAATLTVFPMKTKEDA